MSDTTTRDGADSIITRMEARIKQLGGERVRLITANKQLRKERDDERAIRKFLEAKVRQLQKETRP